ncbi:MAG: ABC transporter permease [Candidatus Eiseniibacteriota bacterium]
MSEWSIVRRRFVRNRVATAGLACLVILYLVAVLAPYIANFDPDAQLGVAKNRLLPPGSTYWLGTDEYARDVWSRMVYGARISLTIGFVAVALSVSIGSIYGAVAAYLGGAFDTVLMRIVDMLLSFPRLVLLIAISALFETRSLLLIMIILGLSGWMGVARIVRGQVLSLKEQDFVQAARALGVGSRRIILRHLLPNAMAPVIVASTLAIGGTILVEAALSFLGLGVPPPTATWGAMVNEGRQHIDFDSAYWISTYPGLAIVFAVVCFNLLGDGLRDALDPRLRGS